MRDLKIRHYVRGDAAHLATLCRRSVEQIGCRDYTPRQVEVWAARAPAPERIHERATDGRITLVAVDASDQPTGFIDLERDGHIEFLYCAPEVVGEGVATALLRELEQVARERGISRLYSEASEAARRFFWKEGFVVTAKREFVLAGVLIHNYAVEKELDDQRAA